MVSRTPPFKWPKDAKNEAFSTTETSFSGWCSASGILVAAGWASLHLNNLYGLVFPRAGGDFLA